MAIEPSWTNSLASDFEKGRKPRGLGVLVSEVQAPILWFNKVILQFLSHMENGPCLDDLWAYEGLRIVRIQNLQAQHQSATSGHIHSPYNSSQPAGISTLWRITEGGYPPKKRINGWKDSHPSYEARDLDHMPHLRVQFHHLPQTTETASVHPNCRTLVLLDV